MCLARDLFLFSICVGCNVFIALLLHSLLQYPAMPPTASLALFFCVVCLVLAVVVVAPESSTPLVLDAFWTRAQQTLLLKELRSQSPHQPQPTINDSLLNSRSFLPLCGNGRIDTQADYEAYYQKGNLPLTLTKQQLLPNRQDVTEPDKLYNLTILADEECDDGNRIDLDGCSADCLYMDLWTTACELATDKTLTYEDLIYDPVRKSMVVSASDGIYAIETGGPDTLSLTMRLIASKTFSVTNMFRTADSLIMYDASRQALWQLKDKQTGGGGIRLVQYLAAYHLVDWIGRCHYDAANGSLVAHDNHTMIYLPSPDASNAVVCNMTNSTTRCVWLENLKGGDSLFDCEFMRIQIGPNGCTELPKSDPLSISDTTNIWSDVFKLISTKTASFHSINKMVYNLSAELEGFSQPLSIESYHPMGMFMEITINSPRKINGSKGFGSDLAYYLGEPSLLDMILHPEAGCGPDLCIFDYNPGFDLVGSNPLRDGLTSITWNDILQTRIVREAAVVSPPLTNLKAVRSDGNYSGILSYFSDIFKQYVAPLEILAMQKHPATHNIWAIRSNKLVEVSKSGVQLRRLDGKCVPSGVALCPVCQWASSGMKCRSCSDSDQGSRAWQVSCQACQEGRRRLLLLGTDDARSFTIKFVVRGDFTKVVAIWPEAVRDSVRSLITVSVVTYNSVVEMRQIKLQLLAMQHTVQVITPPYVVFQVEEAEVPIQIYEDPPEESSSSTLLLVVILCIALPLALVLCLYLGYSQQHGYLQHAKGLGAEYRAVPTRRGYYLVLG